MAARPAPAAGRAPRTCGRCGFDFVPEPIGKPPRWCPDCRPLIRREYQARYRARRQAGQATTQQGTIVVLDDGHPVLPLIARLVDHDCNVRLALAALRTGRLDVAEEALAAELGAQDRFRHPLRLVV